MRTKSLLISIVIALALTACGERSEIRSNLDKWQQQNIQHYLFTINVSCFCPFAGSEVTYEVKDGLVVGTEVYSPDNQPEYHDELLRMYEDYNTIEKVFAYLETANKEADKVTVEYDAMYGYPASMTVDWIELAIDDEMYITIGHFEALP